MCAGRWLLRGLHVAPSTSLLPPALFHQPTKRMRCGAAGHLACYPMPAPAFAAAAVTRLPCSTNEPALQSLSPH